MQTQLNRNRFFQSPPMFVLWSTVLFVAGCGQAPESTPGETSGPAKQTTPSSNGQAAADELVAESSPPKDSPPRVENRKPRISLAKFWDAALAGNLETVRGAIDSGLDVNATDDQSRSALMLASFNGHTPVVKLLLEQGGLLGHRDAMGRTALMFAATGANAETVEFLLNAGADVDAVDTGEGFTALMHAAAEGQTQVVQVLLNHNADPAIRDADGDSARDFAVQNGHADVVQLFPK